MAWGHSQEQSGVPGQRRLGTQLTLVLARATSHLAASSET